MHQELGIRPCIESDLDAIMHLQEKICQNIEDPIIFATTTREENRSFLDDPNTILGVFNGGQLIAYCSLVFPGTNANNLGWDLGWSIEQVKNCATLDTVLVDPSFRGRRLQRILVHKVIEIAKYEVANGFILTTVAPKNSHSLHNMQAEGFQVLLKTEKYGGQERFILGITLRTESV